MGNIFIAGKINKRSNCLNLIRLLAAFDVFFGHAISNFTDYGGNNIFLKGLMDSLNGLCEFLRGVPLFYCISGLLIWDSIERSRSFGEYTRKRVFRIYPELWGAIAVSLITIIVLHKEKINWLMLCVFGATQGTVLQFWTPGFLRDYGNGTPNGALWTICVIVQFYIVCWFVHKFFKGKSVLTWILTIAGMIAVGWASSLLKCILPAVIYKLYCQTFIPYIWLFMLGCFVSEFFDKIMPFLAKYWYIVLSVTIVWNIFKPVNISIGLYSLPGSILCCASCLAFAYALPCLNIKTDISYGIYLYHMVIINVFVELGYTDKWWYIFLSLLITAVFAVISTKTVGKLGLKLKSNRRTCPGKPA